MDCRQILTLSPQPAGTGWPLRIVFADGPGRYVPTLTLSGILGISGGAA
jgi:hypothetical protein